MTFPGHNILISTISLSSNFNSYMFTLNFVLHFIMPLKYIKVLVLNVLERPTLSSSVKRFTTRKLSYLIGHFLYIHSFKAA